tara:strand:- start:1097 stop:1294 length:198 start_codon:yes stop_codon:yes gene_type:complete
VGGRRDGLAILDGLDCGSFAAHMVTTSPGALANSESDSIGDFKVCMANGLNEMMHLQAQKNERLS